MELVNDLKGYQLIFPLPLHVVGTFFLRVNEGSLWNTSCFSKNLTRPLNRDSCQIKAGQDDSSENLAVQASHLHKKTTRQDSSTETFVLAHQNRWK